MFFLNSSGIVSVVNIFVFSGLRWHPYPDFWVGPGDEAKSTVSAGCSLDPRPRGQKGLGSRQCWVLQTRDDRA